MPKYEEIWDIIKKYNFELNLSGQLADLKCCICHGLLRNASQSPCGCRYCQSCIIKYLDGKEKCCPRLFDDCKYQIINIYKDITIDHAANRKISMINVKCPEATCNTSIQLKQVPEHIRTHIISCPFFDVGCKIKLRGARELVEHMLDADQSHALLLMKCLKNIKNDIEDLKGSDSISSDGSTNMSSPANSQISNINFLTLPKISQKISASKMEKEESNICRLESQIEEVNSNCMSEIKILTLEMERLRNELLTYKIGKDLDISTTDSIFSSAYSSPARSYVIKELQEIIAPFMWKITDFMEKHEKAISGEKLTVYSEAFYSHKNGYKMQLRIDPNGDEVVKSVYFSVSFGILAGDYDDALDWPMEKQVKISLINQKTGLVHISKRYRFDSVLKKSKCIFYKPSSRFEDDEDYFFGTSKFIKFTVLFNNQKIFLNDSIVLKCFVS